MTNTAPPKDESQKLAAEVRPLVERLYADPALGRQLATAGRALYEERFVPDAMVRSYLDLYQTLAEG